MKSYSIFMLHLPLSVTIGRAVPLTVFLEFQQSAAMQPKTSNANPSHDDAKGISHRLLLAQFACQILPPI
jgi:hypothetical protein